MAELPLDFDIGLQKTYLEELAWPSSSNKDLRARFLYQWLNNVGCDDTQLTMVFTAFSVAGISRCRKLFSVSQVVFSVASCFHCRTERLACLGKRGALWVGARWIHECAR
ncbi:unnamed protein product [Penicillium nalgiovense]|nr:unnamed protein product [Penicillium nalgiovense]